MSYPKILKQKDLDKSSIIIALDKNEHKAMIFDRFPDNKKEIIYWDAKDLKYLSSEETLNAIKEKVDELIHQLLFK